MKKHFILGFALMCLLTSCTNDTSVENSTSSVTDVTTTTAAPTTTELPKETEPEVVPVNEVIYDANNIKIIYKGISGERNQINFNYYAENNTDRDICIQIRNFSIDGFMMMANTCADIEAGKKINDEIYVYLSEFEKNGIDFIKNVEFSFYILDWKDDDFVIESDKIILEKEQ